LGNRKVLGVLGLLWNSFEAESDPKMQFGCIARNLMHYSGPIWDFACTSKASTMRPLQPTSKPYYCSPTVIMPYYLPGKALVGKREYGEAIAAFRKAIELEPAADYAHFGMAVALAVNGKSEEAGEACKKAIELEDIDYDCARMGCELFNKGKYDDAVAA